MKSQFHGSCWLSCAALAVWGLSSPCLGYQSALPIGGHGRLQRRNRLSFDGFPIDQFIGKTALTSPTTHSTWAPLKITKTFFERLEDRSGKDYGWINPLTQPVSRLMKCVIHLCLLCFKGGRCFSNQPFASQESYGQAQQSVSVGLDRWVQEL